MMINILLCDKFEGRLPGFLNTYQETFFHMFDSVRPGLEYKVFSVQDGELPLSLSSDDLYLISGSRAGAYEDLTWIKELILFIQKAHKAKRKMIGVCFGHQVIAQALGGKVVNPQKGWRTGIHTSRIILPEALEYFPDGTMNLHYNHNDQVTELPKEADAFATSDFCPYEGFIIGKHILTFQGHPEYTPEYNRHCILHNNPNEPEDIKIAALHSLDTMKAQGKKAARWMLDL